MKLIRKTLFTGETTSWRVDFENQLLDVACIPFYGENGSIEGALISTIDNSDVKQTLLKIQAKLELIPAPDPPSFIHKVWPTFRFAGPHQRSARAFRRATLRKASRGLAA